MKVSTNKRKASKRSNEKEEMESKKRYKNAPANVKNNGSEKRYICQICDKQFNQMHHYKDHVRVHTGERPYECGICGHRSKQDQQLRSHMKVHTGEKSHKCKLCDYECSQKGTLYNHMKTHTGIKPFKCILCDYGCSLKQHLQSHIKIHTGEKPFECYHCGHKTSRKEHLKVHIKSHLNKTPFSCKFCDLLFYSKSKLKRHLDITHCKEQNLKSRQHREETTIKKQRRRRFRKPAEVVEKLESPIDSKRKVECFENERVEERPENIAAKESLSSQVSSLECHKSNSKDPTMEETNYEVLACKVCEVEFLDEENMRFHLRSHIADVLNLKTSKSFESAVYSCLSKRKNESQRSDQSTAHFDSNKDTFPCHYEDVEENEEHRSIDEANQFKYSNYARSSTPKTHSSRLEQSSKEVIAGKICEEEFSDADPLASHCQDHMRSHVNEKLYECYFCEYKSSRKENLPIHIRIHFEKEAYECPSCSYNCLDKKQLEDHLKSHQLDNSCNSNFISFQDELSINEEYPEEIKLECELCDMELTSMKNPLQKSRIPRSMEATS